MSLTSNEAGWKIILQQLELTAYLNRPEGTDGRGFLSERDLWKEFEMLDPALLVRERTVRGTITEGLKRAGWTADTLESAGITTYFWRPPEREDV